jgi:putative nucleotidyltransferase with HDIG domain
MAQRAKTRTNAKRSGRTEKASHRTARRPRKRATPGAPTHNRGTGRGGHRLAEAFASVERAWALAESRRRLRRILGTPASSETEVAETVESDVALVVAVIRAAAERGNSGGPVWGVADAVKVLTPNGVGSVADELGSYELLETRAEWQGQLERVRRHSVATRHAAIRVAELGGHANSDELGLSAMLHDIGKLVLGRLYPGYAELADQRAATPEQRIRAERRELGIDHALVGGVLTRKWRLPPAITSTVERHHAVDAEGPAAVIAVADQVAHQAHGNPISPDRVHELGSRAGLDRARLNSLLYEFPHAHTPRKRPPEPSPLSGRELDALRGLADGKVYKEIADDLSVSSSTVRTHLHNVYRKLGAIDRAQAVLIARDKGLV